MVRKREGEGSHKGEDNDFHLGNYSVWSWQDISLDKSSGWGIHALSRTRTLAVLQHGIGTEVASRRPITED